MELVSLNGTEWSFRAIAGPVPHALRDLRLDAAVPGCVHTDLMAAEAIPDPIVGFNEREVQWIGECDWEYRRRFVVPSSLLEHHRLDLVCDGLDTIAELSLNGRPIGAAANMFHPHRFDLRAAAQAGENELVIVFHSPLRHIRSEASRLGPRPVNGDWDPYVFIRKSACNFGWDWAPKLATVGIWKNIGLEAWSGVRIEQVRPLTTRVSEKRWRVDVHVEVELAAEEAGGVLRVEAAIGQAVLQRTSDRHAAPAIASKQAEVDVAEMPHNGGLRTEVVSIQVEDPLLWWPRGQGEAIRYPLEVRTQWRGEAAGAPGTSRRPDGSEPCTQTRTAETGHSARALFIGFRTVTLDTSPDQHGSRFTLLINDRPIFCKGANWIPEGAFPADRTPQKIRARVGQAAAANMNMLRVWGGGFYESDEFYEACDRLGVMVWQDFMFACAMYPEEAPYPAQVEAEARHQVARLSAHPSAVLWCGGNECVWAHDNWGAAPGERPWKDRLQGRTWGGAYYFDLLPRIVRELAPATPYWPNSPWNAAVQGTPNHESHGDRHTWDARLDGYRSIVPRFCSEFGQQSPANFATLARVTTTEGLRPGSPTLEHRQRGTGGTAKHIDEAIAELFGPQPPELDLARWHALAQTAQAHALRTAIEWLRANSPRCMGALVWQLNDCWPGMSWSLIDADGLEKPAYLAVRRAMAPRLLTIQPMDGRPTLVAVNDSGETWLSSITISRHAKSGTPDATAELTICAPPRATILASDLNEALGPLMSAGEFYQAVSQSCITQWPSRPDAAPAQAD